MNDADDIRATRLEAALDEVDPIASALAVAVALRDAGMPQAMLVGIFDAARARHQSDSDERRYNAVLDVIDFISGWCSPGCELYPQRPEGGQ